ncbi:MAG: thiazole biosynthesis adenylyltransferase ThiF [Phycisphaerae bacterium]|nr:thiazole biosynthesis adenylyltransferase ThiF [Phycisphaerae bacterium]
MPNPGPLADEFRRYHRQVMLPGVGVGGQRRLASGHAAVVGCGALGCAIADTLARAGVGRLTIVDRDLVEITNLQRQTLFDEGDAAAPTPKAEAARKRLNAVNSGIDVRAIVADLTAANAERLLFAGGRDRPDLLLDGTDNFETRYLLNDLAVKHGVAYCYGGVVGTTGMQLTVVPGDRPCLRCLFPDPPPPGAAPTCDTAGVLGPAVAIVAACQSADALKILTGNGALVAATLLSFDLWTNERRRLDVSGARRGECPACGARRFEFLDGDRGGATAALCGQDAVQVAPSGVAEIDLARLGERLAGVGPVTRTPFLLRARVPEPGGVELTVFRDGRAIIKGVGGADQARAVYARWVGA